MNQHIYTVSEINQHVKLLIDSDRALGDVYVSGELSNYKVYSSGHHYFTLKDEGGALSAVMFAGDAGRLRFRPESGMKVIIRGRISVYPRDGKYQLYANEMTPDGVGALFIAFEQLKKKLEEKGYFDQSRKRALPAYPEKICIVTSPTGAAVRDMLRILGKRWRLAEVIIVPVRVQGTEAPGEVAAAIDYINAHIPCDFIITGRGGGSMEDLWAFNEEVVADAIFRSAIPVVSAVGHEPDVLISDFVADLRAATPSNAAELTVPDVNEVMGQLLSYDSHMRTLIGRQIKVSRTRLESIGRMSVFAKPDGMLIERKTRLANAEVRLANAADSYTRTHRAKLGEIAAKLDALSPLAVLTRGYSITSHSDGRAVRSAGELSAGEQVTLRFSDGTASATIDGGSKPTPTTKKQKTAKADEALPEQYKIF